METQPESILTLAKLIPERFYTGISTVITRQNFFLIIHLLVKYSPYTNAITSGGFRGGMHPPPTSLKVTILAEKSASISNNSAPFRDASPPTSLNVTNPAEKSLSILVKTFSFFFFFLRPPEFGRKKRLNFRFRPKNHSQFW